MVGSLTRIGASRCYKLFVWALVRPDGSFVVTCVLVTSLRFVSVEVCVSAFLSMQ